MADVFDQVAQEAAQQAAPQGVQAAAQQAISPQGQPQTVSKGDIFDQLAQEDAQAQGQQKLPGTPQEQDFLSKNPDYVYVPRDPKFPNRQEGIYHKNEVKTMNDPQMEHHPVDPDFISNTVGYGVGSAATVGAMAAAPAIGEAALAFAKSEQGKDLIKLVLKHTGEKLLTGAGIGIGYEALHKAAKLLGLD